MTDRTLLEEFGKLFRQFNIEFKLDGPVFRRKLKVASKNVNRWEKPDCWPSPGPWENYKLAAATFVPDAQRTLLAAKLAQLDEVIRRRNSMKAGSSARRRELFSKADENLLFWHSFRDRDADRRGVGNLIDNARERVVISGATLHQVVLRFEDDILEALKSEVLVGIIRSRLTPDLCLLYEPYGRFDQASLATTARLYQQLCDKLSESQKKLFGLFETDILLTHSIGLYDDELFLAEFVMRQHSEHCPTFMPPFRSPTYDMLLSELSTLLTTARVIFGGVQQGLLQSIERTAGHSTSGGGEKTPTV